jgi:hypothetical protein
MTDTRAPAHDLPAEKALLGALLTRPALADRIAGFDPADFYRPQHKVIFDAVRAAVDHDGPDVDRLVVLDRLRAAGELQRVAPGAYAFELVEACPAPGNITWYAGKVHDCAVLRRVVELGMRLQQIGEHAAEQGDLDQALDNAAVLLLDLQVTVDTAAEADAQPVPGLSTVEAFVDETDATHDWVIPGLLERQDRVIVVAGEGAGKSTLARQVAVLTASGRHPLAPDQPIPPQRALYVDLENPVALVRRKMRHLVDRARNLGVWSDGRAFRWTKPGGLDIRRPADARLLERVITETRPAIVCLGPLYKAFASHGDGPEETAAEAAAVFDRLRERHGVTLWLEAHAPLEQQGHRTLRPLGSGLWSRWPEFGIALRKDAKRGDAVVHLDRFRGHRDERSWPVALERDSTWPWRSLWDAAAVRAAGGAP